MTIERLEIITIYWDKVEFKASDDYRQKWDCGLYQIYGSHYAYGQNSLLYIGKAANTFSERLLHNDRLWGDFLETTVSPDTIRLGRLVKHNNDKNKETLQEKNWNKYIDIAEHILISTHTPALNSQLTHKLSQLDVKYKDKGENYLILNLGDRGSLLPEVSTFRNSYLFYGYETPFGM